MLPAKFVNIACFLLTIYKSDRNLLVERLEEG